MDKGNDEIKTAAGSNLFFSPEACSGKVIRGKASDVWACGVTLYFMTYKDFPFIANNHA